MKNSQELIIGQQQDVPSENPGRTSFEKEFSKQSLEEF
jgi:hypothetical protein